jgi:Flp pilus assembly protein TadD
VSRRRRASLVIAMVVMAVSEGACAAECDQDVSRHPDVRRAVSRYAAADLDGAIAELRSALRACPSSSQLHFMLGNALYRHGSVQEASKHYAEAVRYNGRHLEAIMSLGFALFELGDFDGALTQWLAAVGVNPREPFARAALGVGLFAVGRTEEALEQYAEGIGYDSRYADVARMSLDIRWKGSALTAARRLNELRAQRNEPGSNEGRHQ